MRILVHIPPECKSEFEPVDHMIFRAHEAIKRFTDGRPREYLDLTQQFELDLAEALAVCRPDVQRQICECYIWLGKGV